MRIVLSVLALLLLCSASRARDKKAANLAAKAAKLADSAEEAWKRFVLERDSFTDDDIEESIDSYESAVDYYHQSLEVEDEVGLNGAIVLITRRLSKLRFEQMQRQMRKKAEERKKNPPPPKEERPREGKPPKEAPGEPVRPPPRREPREESEPPPVEMEASRSPWPEIMETKAQARRGKQSLRNFLMNYYFASRKFSTLISRCTVCNGTTRRKTGRVDKRRRPVTVPCNGCNATGAHLNLPAARKGFWLVMSPLFRADPAHRVEFEAKLEVWRQDPRKVEEFIKKLRLVDVDYRGLWAVVKYEEIGVTPSKGRQRLFKRAVQRMCLRVGKRWFFYDEQADKDFFSTDDSEEEGVR
ncbi:MAG: hypothetical protein ACYSX0_09010 [Planctomycetota bacterium]|jgi:hypothetical protein